MKAIKRPFATLLAGLAFVGSSYAAPPARKHAQDFKLKISTNAKVAKAQKDMDIPINLKVRNISLHTGTCQCWWEGPGVCYGIEVLRDGHPAPITDTFREILTPKKHDPNELLTWSGPCVLIKPLRSRTFKIPLTRYFDLHPPGKYEISITAGSDPGQPDNIDIRSNTVTITVVPQGAQ